MGTFLVVLLPKNSHFSFTSHLIGFADLPIITTKKREILTDTRKQASREKAPVNVRSTSECDTSECVEHKWMCEAQVNVRSTSECAKHKWMCDAQVNVRSTCECAKHMWMCEAQVTVFSSGIPPLVSPNSSNKWASITYFLWVFLLHSTLSFAKIPWKPPGTWVLGLKTPWVFSKLEFFSPWVFRKRTKKSLFYAIIVM